MQPAGHTATTATATETARHLPQHIWQRRWLCSAAQRVGELEGWEHGQPRVPSYRPGPPASHNSASLPPFDWWPWPKLINVLQALHGSCKCRSKKRKKHTRPYLDKYLAAQCNTPLQCADATDTYAKVQPTRCCCWLDKPCRAPPWQRGGRGAVTVADAR